MIDVSQLPAVRAQLERDAAALKETHAQRAQATSKGAAPQYARAPEATSSQRAGGRPAVVQGNAR